MPPVKAGVGGPGAVRDGFHGAQYGIRPIVARRKRAWGIYASNGTARSYNAHVLNGRRIAVVMPAYNAEATLARTLSELDRSVVDEVVLVDDASTDETVALAGRLGLEPISHERNLGYGGNQKTCYRRALELGVDIVVMVHPDYQYSPLLVPAMASMIAYGEYDLVLGSRILAQSPVARGMPRYKYVANRFLTLAENIVLAQKLSEYHTGLRAFSRNLLGAVPFERNSDDFVFDNQILVQALAAGARIGELSCPTRYQAESSSINLRRSIRYGMGVLRTSAQYRLQRHRLRRYPYLDIDPAATLTHLAAPGVKAGEVPAAPEADPASRVRSGNS
jgi:glycosyltransferase involved in cell wall biosynthesis